MFSFRNFVKTGFLKAIGHMADYQIILNAAGWAEKGVLTEDDLAEINATIEAQYQKPAEEMETAPEEMTTATEGETKETGETEIPANDGDSDLITEV